MSAHPVAAIWHHAIILSFTWLAAGRATWQPAVLFIFPDLVPLWIQWTGWLPGDPDGASELPLYVKWVHSGPVTLATRALSRPPTPVVKLRLRWLRWSREQTCGFTLESVQLHQGLDDLGLFSSLHVFAEWRGGNEYGSVDVMTHRMWVPSALLETSEEEWDSAVRGCRAFLLV